jgi:hypothetical protein
VAMVKWPLHFCCARLCHDVDKAPKYLLGFVELSCWWLR